MHVGPRGSSHLCAWLQGPRPDGALRPGPSDSPTSTPHALRQCPPELSQRIIHSRPLGPCSCAPMSSGSHSKPRQPRHVGRRLRSAAPPQPRPQNCRPTLTGFTTCRAACHTFSSQFGCSLTRRGTAYADQAHHLPHRIQRHSHATCCHLRCQTNVGFNLTRGMQRICIARQKSRNSSDHSICSVSVYTEA